MISYGHTRIGYIGDTDHDARYRAYRDIVRDHGLDTDAALTLVDRINKVHKLPMKIFIPHKLIVRESTAIGNITDKGSYI